MANTTAQNVIDSFESSFGDKHEIPFELEIMWLQRAIGRYSVELDKLNFDDETLEFDTKLDRYVIDTLGRFMYQYYQERVVSIVNKRARIVGKDLSIDAGDGTKNYEKQHLEYVAEEARDMVENQKPTAYV